MNTVTGEVLGESGLVAEDLSNVVDLGTQIFNASAVDNYVRSLVNHIGRVIFVNRAYAGSAPSVLMDAWEFGSVLEKISAEIPEAEENESWELTDGTSYDVNVFHKPTVTAKFFNSRVTFEVPWSFTERQVKESFSSAEQLNGFVSMLYSSVEKSMTVKLDALIMRTINNMTGETIKADYGSAALSSKSGVKAINLLYLYNGSLPSGTTPLTASEAVTNPDFIRYAVYVMSVTASRMSKMSTLYNIGGKARFTPADVLHVCLLADFQKAADVFLQSNTFHETFTRLPGSESVPYWQGSGDGYSFADVSRINITTASGTAINASGILGVMYDRDALGVTNLDRRVTTSYNPKGEFFNNWYKMDAGYFNDTNENFVVFFVA
jgi:hypothetical protein